MKKLHLLLLTLLCMLGVFGMPAVYADTVISLGQTVTVNKPLSSEKTYPDDVYQVKVDSSTSTVEVYFCGEHDLDYTVNGIYSDSGYSIDDHPYNSTVEHYVYNVTPGSTVTIAVDINASSDYGNAVYTLKVSRHVHTYDLSLCDWDMCMPQCSVCSYDTSYPEHTYNSGVVTKAATYTSTGVKTYTCLNCGYKKYVKIPARILPESKKKGTPKLIVKKRKIVLATGLTQDLVKSSAVRPTDKRLYKIPKLAWKVSNKKILRVKGNKITALKAGRTHITCVYRHKKYSILVVVKNNTYVNHEAYYVEDYTYGEPGIVVKKAYYKGSTLYLKLGIYNYSQREIYKFQSLRIHVYDMDDHDIAHRAFRNIGVDIDAYSSGSVTVKIPKAKKIDIRGGIYITANYLYRYYL